MPQRSDERRIIHPKDLTASIFVKKEDLPKAVKDILYPEEIRAREIERRLKEEKHATGI